MTHIKIRLKGLPKDVEIWSEFLRAMGALREASEPIQDPENSYLVIRHLTASLQPVENDPIDMETLEKLINYFRGDGEHPHPMEEGEA